MNAPSSFRKEVTICRSHKLESKAHVLLRTKADMIVFDSSGAGFRMQIAKMTKEGVSLRLTLRAN